MTVREAIKKSGTPVALSGASVDAAEAMLATGENVRHAVVANCAVGTNGKTAGALVVSSHRIYFCTSTLGSVRGYSLFFRDCVGVGDITGGLICRMHLASDDMEISVELGNKKQMAALQAAILDAIAAFPNQAAIDFDPPPASPKPEPDKDYSTIKICRSCGDRLLAAARKCPSCGSKDLVELARDDMAGISAAKAAAGTRQRTTAAPTAPVSKKNAAQQRITDNKAAGVACCPKCGSTSLSANKKGFGLGKAAAGAFVAGPVGLVGGMLGANKIKVTCLNCGHQFVPGK